MCQTWLKGILYLFSKIFPKEIPSDAEVEKDGHPEKAHRLFTPELDEHQRVDDVSEVQLSKNDEKNGDQDCRV